MRQMFVRATGGLLIFLMSVTTGPLFAQQAPASNQPSSQTTQPPIELPENPGSTPAQTSTRAPQQNTPQTPKQPSGTAVAPSVQVSGGAASKPAGVAIAPPRQHQVRSWLIRFGFIAGAGAAIGTVAALSAASPAHVPGSGH